jgi:hypothetical protein
MIETDEVAMAKARENTRRIIEQWDKYRAAVAKRIFELMSEQKPNEPVPPP